MTAIETYRKNTQLPWGQMFYRLLWDQLAFAKGLSILDFGSGLGITANHLAACNDVTAVEPSPQMCEMRFCEHPYRQIIGGAEVLTGFESESFDLILCHNVLEYVEDRDVCVSALCRLLKPGGQLSLVKHNPPGRVLQKVAFENNPVQALQLLNGEASFAEGFGQIHYYSQQDWERWMDQQGLRLLDHHGIRAFFALYADNATRYDPEWTEAMFALEQKAGAIEEYRNIAFYHHVLMQK